ncbi:MAG: radical SAM protein [Candidatus Omnitrophica bacterium]|nr:radical SAM protein [Candidatus Omnitrophota bacterium]
MPSKTKERFHIILIKPSRYDDEGYVIRWGWGIITSNSLACLYSLTQDVFKKGFLGENVEPVIHTFDETVQKIPVRKLCQSVRKRNEKAIACMVGVQTNQYARAVDLAIEFKAEGIPSMIGGFHVSGVMAMLPDKGCGLQEAMDQGITLVAGEVEEKWGELLEAAFRNRLEPAYDLIGDRPNLENVPGPILPQSVMSRFFERQTSFDAGRGCPFKCSFCTIIHIQGNTMRGRNADDIEKLVRTNFKNGSKHIFITDDNFARHKDWEAIADRLIYLKEQKGIRCSLMIQTDVVAHKIPNFIEKMTRAGVRRVFIGMESVNPDNLKAAGKHQNQLKDYREMLQKWRDHGALTCAGYIIGFPGDTYESIRRDVDFLKHELPLDLAEFFVMTPLPGSKDHQDLYLKKVPMAEDTNLYDSAHACNQHPSMSNADWMRAYRDAWDSFYSREHLKTLLLRRKGPRRRLLFASLIWFCSSVFLTDVHPLLGGFWRIKNRRERRPGMPKESFIPFYAKRIWVQTRYFFGFLALIFDIWLMTRSANHPKNQDYQDVAITPEKKVIEASVL